MSFEVSVACATSGKGDSDGKIAYGSRSAVAISAILCIKSPARFIGVSTYHRSLYDQAHPIIAVMSHNGWCIKRSTNVGRRFLMQAHFYAADIILMNRIITITGYRLEIPREL